ncbi:MAG: hypothetical protein QXG65_00840 [Thermoplasmata archaeon]
MVEPSPTAAPASDSSRSVEIALRRFGFARVEPRPRAPEVEPAFWVRRAGGAADRAWPVFIGTGEPATDAIGRWFSTAGADADRRAIVVVPSDAAAEEAWREIHELPHRGIVPGLSILVVPPPGGSDPPRVHWHARPVSRAEVLRLATGIVVGLFRRAQGEGGPGAIDFEELLVALRRTFGVDVYRSLGVHTDEDALYLIYQMALRHAYAPGDPGANLHLLVLKPSGPASRLPWFAA